MRPLEWLFALSFLPILFTPLLPQRWRQRWLFFALLPALTCIVQVVVEGWRIQLVPLYALALFVLITRLPALLGREVVVRRGRGMVMSTLGALALGCSILGAAWLLPVVDLPDPTGPYAVGMVDREVVNSASGRRLMVSVWYPTAQRGDRAPLTKHPREVTTALGKLAGLPGVGLQHLRYFMLDANDGVPVLDAGAPWPVLVFSHGMVGLRLQSSPLMQELASWGYVVIAIDHTDAAAVTVFPDGEARDYDLARFGIPMTNGEVDTAMMDVYVFPVWVADQQLVYDTIMAWAATNPFWAGRLDVTRIGSFGHSFGGATALELCRVDVRCRAAVNLDGGLYGETAGAPAVRPVLLITSGESGELDDAVVAWSRMIENAQAPAYWLEILGSTHLSFTITPFLSPVLAQSGLAPRQGHALVAKYVRSFFDVHVRGVEGVPLGPTVGETDVRWLTN